MSRLRTAALAMFLAAVSMPATVVSISAQDAELVTATVAPPPLPVYLQPPVPGPGYLWSPGYWNWDPAFGYYWVPGTWVR